MTLIDIKEAVLIGVFLAFMIGPVFFMLIQISILKGFRAAMSFDFGVVMGDVFFLLIAYFGSRSILLRIKDHPYLFIFGGLVMIIYGVITFLSKKQDDPIDKTKLLIKDKTNYIQLFTKGFLLNFINVGVLGFWLGMVMVYGAKFDMEEHKIFWFFLTVVLGYIATDIIKVLLAKKLREKMTPTRILIMKKIMGLILIIFGIVLIIRSYIPKEEFQNYIDNLYNYLFD
jgi:threonine/homoserine/homoserine lactone efflux protein